MWATRSSMAWFESSMHSTDGWGPIDLWLAGPRETLSELEAGDSTVGTGRFV